MAENSIRAFDEAFRHGDETTRAEIKRVVGGDTTGGIIWPTPGPRENLILFTDSTEGRAHGYTLDRWHESEPDTFLYTGQGDEKHGSQSMTSNNLHLLNSTERGAVVRLFETIGTVAGSATKLRRYVGELVIDPKNPFQLVTVPNLKLGGTRQVVEFRLKAASPGMRSRMQRDKMLHPRLALPPRLVALEEGRALEFNRKATEMLSVARGERVFEDALSEHLIAQGLSVDRWRIPLDHESDLLTDVYTSENQELFEVKQDASRAHIRTAVAQLLEYSFHLNHAPARLTVVTPEPPTRNLTRFVRSVRRNGERLRCATYDGSKLTYLSGD